MLRVVLATIAVVTVPAAAAALQPIAPLCTPAGAIVQLPGLPEASGVAVSLRTPGRLWAHNDSGQPVLYALDGGGAVTGRVELSGAAIEDWEALASGPCGSGSCLYVADIGDNDAERRRVTVYRIPEPAGTEPSVAVKEIFHATYPDGPHDAEALLVTPGGALVIVTKGEAGPVALYRFPDMLRPGGTHRLERVGTPRDSGRAEDEARITDGAVSPDGIWVVLRTSGALSIHAATDLMTGEWREAQRVDLKAVGEPQGEGVAIASDGSVYLTGEGGGNGRPGTLARLTCPGLAPR